MSGTAPEMLSPTQRRSSTSFTRRDFLAGLGALSTGLMLDAGEIGRHTIDVVHRTLQINRLPEAFHGYRVVQLSDIHLDEFTERSFLRLVIHRINRLAPDLVLLTGDFASRDPLPTRYGHEAILHCAEIVKELTCPLRYGVLGNHDTGIGSQFVVDTLKGIGIPILVNQHIPIERHGQRFWLGGVDDPGTANPILDLAVPRDPDGPVILMSHPPDFADDVVKHPRGPLVDVMLSGHSHGGQVRLPFLGPLILPPMGTKYVAGLFRFNAMQLYVNRGIGTVGLPIRFNCLPEITHFTLQSS